MPWDIQAEDEEWESTSDGGEDGLEGAGEQDPADNSKEPELKMFKRPAADHPEWQWVMMWRSWTICCDYMRQADYRNPDLFGMYIYNDWHGWGLNELIENLLVEFSAEFRKQKPDVKHMRGTMAGLVHWMMLRQDDWIHDDDGDGTAERYVTVGYAFLALLNEVDRLGQLKADSEFRDLGLVMALYVLWAQREADVMSGMHDDPYWYHKIVGYARQAAIDLTAAPFREAKTLLDDMDDEVASDEDAEEERAKEKVPPEGKAKPDRWGFKARIKNFEEKYGKSAQGGKPKLGGQQYDITKMSRSERASHAFDDKDPLADIPIKELKAGNISLR
ncbi:hypothetical protein LTR95_013449 [Oleoguttula sp. CCFEE 5521]